MAGAFGRRRNVGGMGAGFGFGHEVSNPAHSALKLRGVAPRAKVSMTRIRPAQHGHALSGAEASERSVVGGASVVAPSSTRGFFPTSATGMSSRKRAIFAARLWLANSP